MILALLALALCVADVATTEYAIETGAGYEGNWMIAPVIGTSFYIVKVAFFSLTLAAISKMDTRMRFSGFLTLTIFYAIVVLNNLLVIFCGTDLGLDTAKLLLIFLITFLCAHSIAVKSPC